MDEHGDDPGAKNVTPATHREVPEDQLQRMAIITGTPRSVIPKLRRVLEYIRPGSLICWDGDGSMTHDDAMRSIRLFGQEVIPALREIGKELGLRSPFEVDTSPRGRDGAVSPVASDS
jgi:hypothetical protein